MALGYSLDYNPGKKVGTFYPLGTAPLFSPPPQCWTKLFCKKRYLKSPNIDGWGGEEYGNRGNFGFLFYIFPLTPYYTIPGIAFAGGFLMSAFEWPHDNGVSKLVCEGGDKRKHKFGQVHFIKCKKIGHNFRPHTLPTLGLALELGLG